MSQAVEQYLGTLPPVDEVLRKLEDNAVERQLLRELLRLAKKHDVAKPACNSPRSGVAPQSEVTDV